MNFYDLLLDIFKTLFSLINYPIFRLSHNVLMYTMYPVHCTLYIICHKPMLKYIPLFVSQCHTDKFLKLIPRLLARKSNHQYLYNYLEKEEQKFKMIFSIVFFVNCFLSKCLLEFLNSLIVSICKCIKCSSARTGLYIKPILNIILPNHV